MEQGNPLGCPLFFSLLFSRSHPYTGSISKIVYSVDHEHRGRAWQLHLHEHGRCRHDAGVRIATG
jgi:hypothetical protein